MLCRRAALSSEGFPVPWVAGPGLLGKRKKSSRVFLGKGPYGTGGHHVLWRGLPSVCELDRAALPSESGPVQAAGLLTLGHPGGGKSGPQTAHSPGNTPSLSWVLWTPFPTPLSPAKHLLHHEEKITLDPLLPVSTGPMSAVHGGHGLRSVRWPSLSTP